jgi:hypothetical protein
VRGAPGGTGYAFATSMTALDRVLPAPRLVEINHVDLAASPQAVWNRIRYDDLGRGSALVRALFAARTWTTDEQTNLKIDALRSLPEKPGFQVLVDEPPHEVVVGAIGKVWQLEIPFVHVDTADRYRDFEERGFVKVAWAIRVLPRGHRDARVELELRVDATDEESWKKFRIYFAVIGIGSHFIRRTLLAGLARELGDPEAKENERSLVGDGLLLDAREQLTHGVTIRARPETIWPWLVQLGCDRAGFYSIDLLDNGGRRSAREIHPELQEVHVGDILPARLGSPDGFEVLHIEPKRALVLGGLWDALGERQLPFASARPERFWHVTWAFVLEPLDHRTTRLHVRARAAFPKTGAFHAAWIRPVHSMMEAAQLHGIKARAEGTLSKDDLRDVLAGIGGAARMALALATPVLRSARSHWGITAEAAGQTYPGDDLVPAPRWTWTHGIEIDASAAAVWPWIAQIGANKGGFYSYQWLENLAGCNLRNAERIHPEWEATLGDELRLHPDAPALRISAVERGLWFVAYGAPDSSARAASKPWVAASWLFLLEPMGDTRCRLISRYRAACSDDLWTRLSFGPTLIEPVGFAMDRRLLLGVKALAEKSPHATSLRHVREAPSVSESRS